MRTFIILLFVAVGLHWAVHSIADTDFTPLFEHAAPYAPPPKPDPAYQAGLDSTLFLEFDDGTCTGVVLSKHTLMTATHCIEGSELWRANGVDVKARVIANDGNDHVIMRVNIELSGRPAKVKQMPPPGARVYIWGNPSQLRMQLRIGHVAGWYKEFHTIDMNTWHGDSGAAIFDSAGNVVGLVYGTTSASNGFTEWSMGLAYPITFTPSQLAYQ